MGIIQEMLTQDHEEKQTIDRKVSEQHIMPTQGEQQKANDVIRIISEKYAEKLKDHSIQEIENELIDAIREECESLNLSYEEQKRIEKTVIVTALGQGPIEEYLRDPTVTEIVVQRYDNVVIERNGKIESVKAVFFSEDHLVNTIERIVQSADRQINITYPIALVSSNGCCVLYKGGALKSANQWYNKQMADCRSLAMKGHTADEAAKLGLLHTKKMQSLSRRRNQFFHDTMHKIASDIVHFCLASGITTIVIGKNKNWKQKSNIGHVNNQNFVQIPLETLRWMITYKAESAGLIVVEQEESYTSKASLVDKDEIPVYGKETKNLVAFSGRRIKRGLYRTGSGQVINADLNGAGNILRKYIPDAFKDRKDFVFLDQILVRNYPCLNKRIPVKGIGAA